MTEKLYYQDVHRQTFQAKVRSVWEEQGKYCVILDQTAFYPEGGGQPCDTGLLGDIPVEAVEERELEVVHILPSKPSASCVNGEIDMDRRRTLMQQHSGQHILSAILFRLYEAATAAVHLGLRYCTLDVDRSLSPEEVRSAEQAANEAVYSNIAVETLYPDAEEVERLSRKKPPGTTQRIRIVKTGDIDYTPCCGTHVTATGEVGMIRILKQESWKGGIRLTFVCGQPALDKFRESWDAILQMQTMLSVGDTQLAARVSGLLEEIRQLKKQRQTLLSHLLESQAADLLGKAVSVSGYRVVSAVLDDTDQESMKGLFHALTAGPNVIAFLGGQTESGAMLLFGCHRAVSGIPLRECFQSSLKLIDGRGGGSDVFAQGMGRRTECLRQAVEDAEKSIIAHMEAH